MNYSEYSCTTQHTVTVCLLYNISGRVVAMMSPDESWVAKWQRIGKCIIILILGKGFPVTQHELVWVVIIKSYIDGTLLQTSL